MNEPFHNSYHFVPAHRGKRSGDVAVGSFAAGEVARLRHDRYTEDGHSGRLLCKLTLATPTFVGAERTPGSVPENTPGVSKPFELDEGIPALPASSLRGMISAVAEAASQSALRILGNKQLSYRKVAGRPESEGGPLSALGMIWQTPDDCSSTEGLALIPLAVPVIPSRDGVVVLPKRYSLMFAEPRLKAFVGDLTSPTGRQAMSAASLRTTTADDIDQGRFYYLPLPDRPTEWEQERGQLLLIADESLRFDRRSGKFLMGWEAGGALPSREPSEGACRGVLRVLGRWEDDIGPRKHEMFLPWPEDATEKQFPIRPVAVRRFYDLADERFESGEGDAGPLPYEPVVTQRSPGADDGPFRLKRGDLVFFRPDEGPAAEQVAEISLSSIWRGRVETLVPEAATAHDFFAAIDPELVPFHSGRRSITVAEQVFGFVAAKEQGAEPETAVAEEGVVRGAASRVRFSFGRVSSPAPEDGYYLPAVTLKTLGNPKPPAPALYFRPRQGSGYIAKSSLDPRSHRPQGRKFYLHHEIGDGDDPWRSRTDERGHLKTEVRPIRRGLEFLFHVDFDNLSREELGLLCYAIQPTAGGQGAGAELAFHHKLGMGKSLGLGSVRVDPVGLFLVDRRRRYGVEGFFEPRYASCKVGADRDSDAWPEEYRAEREVASENADTATAVDFVSVRDDYAATMDPGVRASLERLGTTFCERVSTPFVQGEPPGTETETYRWFVANDQGSGRGRDRLRPQEQHMKPVTEWIEEKRDGLPTLDPNPWRGK